MDDGPVKEGDCPRRAARGWARSAAGWEQGKRAERLVEVEQRLELLRRQLQRREVKARPMQVGSAAGLVLVPVPVLAPALPSVPHRVM